MTQTDLASPDRSRPPRWEEQPDDEQTILRRAQQRDPDACREIVRRYYGMVYKLAYNFLSNAEDAKDLAQEAFMRAFGAIDRFDLRLRFAPWIKKIATNLVTDAIRARYRSKSTPLDSEIDIEDDSCNPANGPEQAEESALVRRVVASLPPTYRTVLVLRDLEDHTMEEIANLTNCPQATVRWRLHQARKLFKEKWERMHSR